MPQRDHTHMTTVEAWGMTQETRVWIGGNNESARREVELLVGDSPRPATGEVDRAFITPLEGDEAVYFARKMRARLAAEGSIWVIHPKSGGPKAGEFSGSIEEMAIRLFELGFAESGRVNLDGDYSSTGFTMEGGPVL